MPAGLAPGFRPMLATTVRDLSALEYPMYVTPKVDGIRCIMTPDGAAYSRRLKPIPNEFVQQIARELMSQYDKPLDGELFFEDFSQTQSRCLSSSEVPFPFRYYVFDVIDPTWFFYERMAWIAENVGVERIDGGVQVLAMNYDQADGPQDLMDTHDRYIDAGWEGLIARANSGLYKYGRVTENEAQMVKVKPYWDMEAAIVRAEERRHAEVDEDDEDDDQPPKEVSVSGVLGSLVCERDGVEFRVGSGFSEVEARMLWSQRDNLPGRMVTIQHQGIGSNGRPRIPVYKGLRPEMDKERADVS